MREAVLQFGKYSKFYHLVWFNDKNGLADGENASYVCRRSHVKMKRGSLCTQQKSLLILIFFLFNNYPAFSQLITTLYASCGATNGSFVLSPQGQGYTFLWSTGSTSCCISVPPGNYSVTVTDTINATSYNLNPNMWEDTWQLHIVPLTGNSILMMADLFGCQSVAAVGPSCNPLPYNGAYGIVWEDSIPVDTINNVSCDMWSASWYSAQPGHCYDFSIFDPSCNCFQATWMYTPSRKYCLPFTQLQEEDRSLEFKISPNPFQTTATLGTINSKLEIENCRLRIFNTLGALIREEKILNITSYLLHRNGLSDGLYFYELRTNDYQLIGSGKFVVN